MSRKRIERNISYDDRNHLYYVTFHYGTDPLGRRVKRTKTYHTHLDAAHALRVFEEKKRRCEITPPNTLALGEWLQYWYRTIVEPNRARSTAYGYSNIIRRHIIPALGSIPLQELSPAQIQTYYAAALEKGLNANTVCKHHQLLFASLECAVRQELLGRNPARLVTAPPKVSVTHFFYSADQMNRLFDAVRGHPYEAAVKLAGYLGLRRGEICALRWEHIDFTRATVSIRAARTSVGGTSVEKLPKTESSVRTLGIEGMQDLLALLRELERRQTARRKDEPAYNPRGFVLVREDGTPLPPDELSKWFSAYVLQLGLPKLTLHGLRHSFASLANELHIPLFKISRALGHSSTGVTGQIYTHLFDDTQNDVLRSIAAFIEEAPSDEQHII